MLFNLKFNNGRWAITHMELDLAADLFKLLIIDELFESSTSFAY